MGTGRKKGVKRQDRKIVRAKSFHSAYKGRKNCSRRTQVASKCIDSMRASQSCNGTFTDFDVALKKLRQIPQERPKNQKTFPIELLQKMNVLFVNRETDDLRFCENLVDHAVAMIDEKEMLLEKQQMSGKEQNPSPTMMPYQIDLKDSGLELIDDPNGCTMIDSGGNPVFVLIPRKLSIMEGNRQNEVDALKKILSKCKNVPRCASKVGIADKYASIGATVCRNAKGIDVNFPDCIQSECDVVFGSMAARAEKCAKAFLPKSVLEGIRYAKDVVRWPMPDVAQEYGLELWPSSAISCNYVSGSHCDKDMFLSLITVSNQKNDTASTCSSKDLYEYEMPVAAYVPFPAFSVAIALRPGDQILFNPQYFHSVCMRQAEYKDDKLFVTSFYLKTGVVGGNNNDIPLTPKQLEILNMNM